MWHVIITESTKFIHHMTWNLLEAFFTNYAILRIGEQKDLCDVAQAALWSSSSICSLTTNNSRMLIWCKQSRIIVTVPKLNITALDNCELPGLPGWSWRCQGSQVRPHQWFFFHNCTIFNFQDELLYKRDAAHCEHWHLERMWHLQNSVSVTTSVLPTSVH